MWAKALEVSVAGVAAVFGVLAVLAVIVGVASYLVGRISSTRKA